MNSRVPRQVREAGERSERLIEELKKGKAGQGTPAPAPASAAPPQEAATHDQGTPPGDAPATQGDAPGAPGQQPPSAAPRTDYKAQYFTLQGMHNALKREMAGKDARIAQLEAQLASSAGRDAPSPTPTPAPTPTPSARKVPDAVRETLGDEVADALQTMFDTRDADVAAVTTKVEHTDKTAQDIAKRQAEENKTKFLAALTELVPDWQDYDNREDWNEFLAQRDPMARRVRNDLIVEAVQEGDVVAVAAIFNAFKAQAGISSATPAPAPAPTPASAAAPAPTPAPDNRRAQLERQVVPNTATAQTTHTEKKIWTRDEIARAYAKAATGETPADVFKPIEADILAASREGRIAAK